MFKCKFVTFKNLREKLTWLKLSAYIRVLLHYITFLGGGSPGNCCCAEWPFGTVDVWGLDVEAAATDGGNIPFNWVSFCKK